MKKFTNQEQAELGRRTLVYKIQELQKHGFTSSMIAAELNIAESTVSILSGEQKSRTASPVDKTNKMK